MMVAEPLVDAPKWPEFALCRGRETRLWYPPQGVDSPEAKAVCHACPVREPCLDHAIRHRERHGIWGGLGEKERRNLARRVRQRATA